jgi:signal transduction histidine kinase
MAHAPLPRPTPAEFLEAERQELALGRPDLAMPMYQALAAQRIQESLALNFIARCLTRLNRIEEARAIWRRLVNEFPNDRDLAHRPYGIVAAIAAGDTAGLFDRIATGEWELSADQTEAFLTKLDPGRAPAHLDRFRFARELETVVPSLASAPGLLTEITIGARRVFFRGGPSGRIDGFALDEAWALALREQIVTELQLVEPVGQRVAMYGGAVAVVLLVLCGGVLFLFRDLSREERLNRLRADFISGVTHELKTPVTIMRLYGETLLGQQLTEAERRDFYRVIARESARLGRLLEQVLSFSRVERGETRYDLREADLAPAVSGIVDSYADWLEHAGFVLDRRIDVASPPVRFDAAAVSQAVVNLLDNAMKYSGASRSIAVRLASAPREVTLEIQDCGIGIPAAEHERIFQRFHRVANHTGKGGYGLGLYMVRHIMDAHGGRAEVDSEPGRGSTFRLIFPVAHS